MSEATSGTDDPQTPRISLRSSGLQSSNRDRSPYDQSHMRIILALLSAALGALAGWFALAMLVIALAGPDRDGGIAMGAFFNIGPVGAVAGLIAGVWLFIRIGLVRNNTPALATESSEAAPHPETRLSFPFAATLLLIAAIL